MEINKLVRLLMPSTIEGVLKAPKLSHQRVIDNLNKVNFVTRRITMDQDNTEVELQVLDENNLSILLAGEANNFFLASLLTYDRAIQIQQQNAAWQVIEHYYAAFYAVHYLIRIAGISLTNIDMAAEKSIVGNQITSGVQRANGIPKGIYIFHYENDASKIILKKITRRGGSHTEVWRLWLELIDKLNAKTNDDPVEYTTVSVGLNAHKNFLIRSGGMFNPPEIRGEINYQFKGGLWRFENKPDSLIRSAQTLIAERSLPVPATKMGAEALVSNNNIIINFARAMFSHAAQTYPRSICRSLANKYETYL